MLSRQARTFATRAAASRTPVAQVAFASPLARNYAQAASAPDSKPPVAVYGIDGTYASALVRADDPVPMAAFDMKWMTQRYAIFAERRC